MIRGLTPSGPHSRVADKLLGNRPEIYVTGLYSAVFLYSPVFLYSAVLKEVLRAVRSAWTCHVFVTPRSDNKTVARVFLSCCLQCPLFHTSVDEANAVVSTRPAKLISRGISRVLPTGIE